MVRCVPRGSRHVPFSEFRQSVRAFAPSHLIPELARRSSLLDGPPWDNRVLHRTPPWAIAAAARESVLAGTERRDKSFTDRALRDMMWKYLQGDPLPHDGSLARLLTPLLHEQFVWQESPYEEMARSQALLADTANGGPDLPWADLIGVDIRSAIRSVMVLHAGVRHNRGQFAMAWLDARPEVYDAIAPRREIEATFAYLTRTIPEHRAVADRAGVLRLENARYAFNPLRTAPFVRLDDGTTWAPLHAMIPISLSVGNLYYAGRSTWGKSFADDLGLRMESYVGRQLRSADNAVVHPEVDYGSRKKPGKSIDWFFITETAVVLVECKSARLLAGALRGDDSLSTLSDQYLGKASEQIDATAKRIHEGHEAFRHIPTDRPLIGLTITAEPFYLANSGLPEYGHRGEVPTMVGSLRDLEELVRLPADEIGKRLHAIATDPNLQKGRLIAGIGDVSHRPDNAILDAAWRTFDLLGEVALQPPIQNARP